MPDIFVAPHKRKNTAPKNETVLEKQPDRKFMRLPILEIPIKKINSVHLFSSYCEKPEDISFENQEKGEKILLFVRRDLITNLPWIIKGIFLILAPFMLLIFEQTFKISFFMIPERFSVIFLFFYYLLVASYWYINFITWYFNISFITDRRVVDIDFEGLIYKNVAATKLSLVQDVSYSQIGVTRTFFNYGDVLIQTAGTIDNFIIDCAPKPEDVVHVVEDLIGKNR